jgi:hypothetical protein
VLDGALADTNPITATTIYLDAADGVDFQIDDEAPLGDWMIAWGLHDEDLEVRAWSDAFFQVVE